MANGYLTERLEIRCDPELKSDLEELAKQETERNANALARKILREGIARRKALLAEAT